ncbi:MAG: hypothetical protein M0P33_07425 [Massilibacteroides sp.]|nr:hypothetical protein [Massilibacteroides sp.]
MESDSAEDETDGRHGCHSVVIPWRDECCLSPRRTAFMSILRETAPDKVFIPWCKNLYNRIAERWDTWRLFTMVRECRPFTAILWNG